jgi:hypothetical protein
LLPLPKMCGGPPMPLLKISMHLIDSTYVPCKMFRKTPYSPEFKKKLHIHLAVICASNYPSHVSEAPLPQNYKILMIGFKFVSTGAICATKFMGRSYRFGLRTIWQHPRDFSFASATRLFKEILGQKIAYGKGTGSI